MGGFVGDVLGGVGDVVSDTLSSGADLYKKIQAPIFDNAALIGTGVGAYLGGPAGARLGGMLGGAVQGGLGGSGTNILGGGTPQNYGNVLSGAAETYGGMVQSKVSKEAIQAAQEEARRAGQQASTMAGFRPVGITTRFGASQFQVDPTTGQLTSAGYTTSPELQAAQERLMGLGAGYLAQTPEEVAQKYLASQMDLLAPSRERQLAELRNRSFQTGREGLSVGATGLRPGGGLGLKATNPEMEAYYNALAQQDAALAAQAQQAGQQQVGFGAGLFGQAGQLEQLAQQPLSLSTQLANLASTSGYRAGTLGLEGALRAAGYGLRPELQYSQTASILNALTSPTSTLGRGIAGLFNNYDLNKAASDYMAANPDIFPTSTFSGYGDIGDLAQYGVF